ncbi:MAG: glutamate--tRNA ligase [Alphaproteobacteria bacterium]|nr:glutamate--tRNA ligase [Alphaproteobacteria bacterium]MCB9929594.1 glutamate--tRNA ligase [Alphaproteobacteria bacterium]
MTLVCRFAPSPTGYLHVGNARVALLNWLLARKAGGVFILRLDDTDTERSTDAFAEAIREDMTWLGLAWDRSFRQIDRMARYDEAFEHLKAAGRLYPCYETPEELGLKRKTQLAQGLPPKYDRAALSLTDAQKAAYEAEGRRPHWRFRLDDADIVWEDAVRGPVRFETAHLTDPVLLREDGRPLYTFSSCVDDVDEGVTHVLRGEDHVSNTAVQVQIIAALGGDPAAMTFAHLPLLTGAQGEGLSKREGSLSLRDLRAQGIEAMAVNSLLARLGTPDPVEAVASLDALVETFDLSRFGRATPKFDPAELQRLNHGILATQPFAAVQARLPAGASEAQWLAVRGNLETLADFAAWQAVWAGTVAPAIEEPDYIAEAAAALPQEPWDATTWKAWTNALKAATGRKGKALFRPLRLALTGREHGPEMAALLPLIGRAKALERLKQG